MKGFLSLYLVLDSVRLVLSYFSDVRVIILGNTVQISPVLSKMCFIILTKKIIYRLKQAMKKGD